MVVIYPEHKAKSKLVFYTIRLITSGFVELSSMVGII